jgi:flagellin
MIINHNLSAINAYRQYNINTQYLSKSSSKLSSGLRITKAADDAAGLAVSEKMRSQIRGLNQASRNAQDGISLIQTTDGWLQETQHILQRMRELAVQAANGIYTYEDRMQIQVEIKQLVDEIDRIASQAEFNTLKVLRGGLRREPGDENYSKGIGPRPYNAEEVNKMADPPVRPVDPSEADPSQHTVLRGDSAGDDKGGIYFHVGANMDQREKVYVENMSAYALGLAKGAVTNDPGKREILLDYISQDGANKAIGQIDSAIYLVNRQRADLGAYQNRLEHTIRGVDIAAENLQSAESHIRDLNMANEMIEYVKNQILTKTSATMLAHANLKPQIVLRVLE